MVMELNQLIQTFLKVCQFQYQCQSTDKQINNKNKKLKLNFQKPEIATELKYKPRTSYFKPGSILYHLGKLGTNRGSFIQAFMAG